MINVYTFPLLFDICSNILVIKVAHNPLRVQYIDVNNENTADQNTADQLINFTSSNSCLVNAVHMKAILFISWKSNYFLWDIYLEFAPLNVLNMNEITK